MIHPNQGHYTLRSGTTIYPSQSQEIDQVLIELLQRLPAHFLLLTDITGQIVAVRGEQDNIDLVALGSLVAGDLAASQEIARLTGEFQDYQMILREGQSMHSFIVEAGLHLALMVQISNEVPLGWARMLIQNGARQLAEILSKKADESEHQETDSIAELSQDELPDLFSDALDELWSE